MASDGLSNKAKNGTCRICQRVRDTDKYLKAVGEVHHGFATGYLWECVDVKECDNVVNLKINNNHAHKVRIEIALRKGRFAQYMIKR